MSAYACALPHRLRAARRLALVLVRKRILSGHLETRLRAGGDVRPRSCSVRGVNETPTWARFGRSANQI